MKIKLLNKWPQLIILNSALLTLFTSCSVQKQIARSAKADVLDVKALQTAHVGISIFDPAENKYLYNYQGNKYFVPASNIKIPTCYAAMKYLGDSLVGLRYGYSTSFANDNVIVIQPTGDPTFLHEEFKIQPAFDFLKFNKLGTSWGLLDTIWKDDKWGSGWSWNDYDATYMAERSSMPAFGNVINIKLKKIGDRYLDSSLRRPTYNIFKTQTSFFDSLINSDISVDSNTVYWNGETVSSENLYWEFKRELDRNEFTIKKSTNKFSKVDIPFVANGSQTASWIIGDSLKIHFRYLHPSRTKNRFYAGNYGVRVDDWHKIHSQPTDSLLKPMMHRSDNFFAEQTLLMVSNEMLGVMNDEKIIDTLLKTDFKDLPQKPRWADGSGLSRYNLFTPQSFVTILNKMKNEFGMERLKVILPTGGEGTISSYYKADSGYIYGKTGTLSGVVAFSGFLYTKKGKLLIFSTLINNHQASATEVRRAVEKFLKGVRNKY
jgi:D-alanyl-D-alanine carboxypeptidase/D-alanyl-D-alanine-endopeptidase (penicillin-binding protein 4)